MVLPVNCSPPLNWYPQSTGPSSQLVLPSQPVPLSRFFLVLIFLDLSWNFLVIFVSFQFFLVIPEFSSSSSFLLKMHSTHTRPECGSVDTKADVRRKVQRKKKHTYDHPPLLSDPIIFFVFLLQMFKSFQCSNPPICSLDQVLH